MLSYGDLYRFLITMGDYPDIVPKKRLAVNQFRHIFCMPHHILSGRPQGRGSKMLETDDPYADLDDLIFDQEEYHPSER